MLTAIGTTAAPIIDKSTNQGLRELCLLWWAWISLSSFSIIAIHGIVVWIEREDKDYLDEFVCMIDVERVKENSNQSKVGLDAAIVTATVLQADYDVRGGEDGIPDYPSRSLWLPIKDDNVSYVCAKRQNVLPITNRAWVLPLDSGHVVMFCKDYRCYVLSIVFDLGGSKDLKKQIQHGCMVLGPRYGAILCGVSRVHIHYDFLQQHMLEEFYETSVFGEFHLISFDPRGRY
ncbi:hypothetical protein L7F22_029954 [Adiantum nelumboides]|nr:hypothetical protein [Adiantum nelumboides]